MITSIDLATVYVSDQDEALKFYVDKLGLVKVSDEEFNQGARWIEVVPPTGGARSPLLALIRPQDVRQPPDRIGGHSGIAFGTNDIQATVETLLEQDVDVFQPPELKVDDAFLTIIVARFRDEDKNEFSLVQAPQFPFAIPRPGAHKMG
jgi:catechol 2,3-dioxygenase-like lactoylglutathione lyase family enzyme